MTTNDVLPRKPSFGSHIVEHKLPFTGERFIRGLASRRIESDHIERYRFACSYVHSKSVLDIACGSGYGGPILKEAGARTYHGIDIDSDCIEFAKFHYSLNGCCYAVGDICTYRESCSYDIVISLETIEHVICYKEAIRTLYAALARGGLMIISSPNRHVTSPGARLLADRPSNSFHTQEFSPSELLIELREAGFVTDYNHVYGQRLRNPLANWICRFFTNRDILGRMATPKVLKCKKQIPRYFLIVAKKK